ncbi:MAG: elongation factor G [Acidaminococcales bacterium]|nr:elongation factor G [Acidaminococcales bacterium]
MKDYKGDKIRNVAIIAHGGAGKTSVTEALLYRSGAITRMGRIEDGNTATDFEAEETKRKSSIGMAIAPVEWRDQKINFLDTPGYADFVGEVKSALRAAESALVVVCAASGVEVETEKTWRYANELKLPRVIMINKMDRENADFNNVVEDLRAKMGAGVLPVQMPIGAEAEFKGIIDLLKMKAYFQQGNSSVEQEIPAEFMEAAGKAYEAMVEAAAETDDEMIMKFLEGEKLTEEEIMRGIVNGIRNAKIYPVVVGSALKSIGMGRVMDAIVDYMPAAVEKEFVVIDKKSGEEVLRQADNLLNALVFKTTTDPFVGRLSYIKVFSGVIKGDGAIYNVSKDKTERIGNIFTLRGKNQIPLKEIVAGDIGVIAKLQDTATGDSIGDKDNPMLFPPIEFPKPMYTLSIEAKNKADEDKIGQALSRLMDEDQTFLLDKNSETKEKLVSGIGDQHLDVIMEKLKRKFSVEAILKPQTVAYRETIRGKARVEGKHKKQSGGHGQYGHVVIEMEPLAPGEGFQFVDSIFGGAVPRQYIPAVEKGMREAIQSGVLAGYPVVDVKINLVDGSYHTVDSSEMAFKIASNQAFKKAALQAKPVLLEPVYNVQVIVPEGNMGDIIGDFNSKRGRILGMEPIGDGQGCVKAQVPYSELLKYAVDLRSMTQGRGSFDMNFSHYDEVPQRIADEIIAKAGAKNSEE